MGELIPEKGFTLLEVLIALIILSVGMMGTLGMIGSSIRGNALSLEMTTATSLASDKIEEMKNLPWDNLFKPGANRAFPANPQIPPADILANCTLPGGGSCMNDVDPDTGVRFLVTAVDDGMNACAPDYPCGDVAVDNIWTFSRQLTLNNKTYDRVWTVQRNPLLTMTVNGVNLPNQQIIKAIKLESIVSWKDIAGRPHRVVIGTIIQ